MSGYFGDLSPQQADALAKLKLAVADIPNKPEDHDHFYLRWLRARKFNVDKAEEMLRNHMVFREEMGLDRILEWTPPEVMTKFTPGGFFGEDRDGNPVNYEIYGGVDLRGFFRSCTRETMVKYTFYRMEERVKVLKEFSERKGRCIDTITSVLDMENVTLQKHYYWPGINLFREALTMLEANYPEMAKRMVVIKAPKVFPVTYNLVRPFIDKRTRDKIIVADGNWKEELLKYISPDQLPQVYGGTRCEPDPWCSEHIKPGGDIPPEYYLTNLTETDKEEMDRVVVGRGGSCELEYEVESEGSVLRWEFLSTGYDINYGWFLKQSSTKKKPKHIEVVSFQRANCHVVPEVGAHTCTTVGTYVLKFDNSYSWTRSKEVFYSVKVLPPDTEPHLPDMPRVDSDMPKGGATAARGMEGDSDDDFYDCDDDK